MAENPRIDDLRRRLEREPGSRVFAQLAEELRKAGQLAEAVRVARQGLLNHPAYPSARMTLGRALLDMRDLRGARTEFEAVLRGAPDNILASRYLGECLEGLGDLGSALLQYRATLRLAPGDRNLEAQIRALEQRLTPSSVPSTPAPPPVTPRPPLLPRDGAIPVLEVDGPMELETPFEKTTPWRPQVAPTPVSATLAAAPPSPPAVTAPDVPAPAGLLSPEPSLVADEAPPSPTALPVEAEPAEPLPPEPLAPSALPTGPPAPAVESLNQSFPDEWEEAAPPAPPAPAAPPSEPAALSSSTLAELYFNQGFTRQAIDVYRELLEREPGNERIRARIVELEAIERAIEGASATPPPPRGDAKARRREAIERTITRLEGFLATVRRA